MAKTRVYELARELGKDNSAMETLIRNLGIDIKNVMSTLEDTQAEQVRRHVRTELTAPPSLPSWPRPANPLASTWVRGSASMPTNRDEPSAPGPRPSPIPTIRPADPVAPRRGTLEPAECLDDAPPSPRPPWDALLQKAGSENPNERRMAIIDACEALRCILKARNVSGRSMLDVLLEAPEHLDITAKELAQAIRANHRRNMVTHENEYPDAEESTWIVGAFAALGASAVPDDPRDPRGNRSGHGRVRRSER